MKYKLTKKDILQSLQWWREGIEKNAGNWIQFDYDWKAIQNTKDATKFTRKYLYTQYKIFIKYV